MKFLITGGSGFIGSSLVRHIIKSTSFKVINVHKFSVMNKNKIQKRFNIDILNWKKALSEYIRETKE